MGAELGLVREGRTQHIFLSDPVQQEMMGWWHAGAPGNVWESPPYTSLPNCMFSAVTFGAEISCGSGIYTTGISKHWSGFTFCPKPQPTPPAIPCTELVSQHTIALGVSGGPLSSSMHGRYHFLIRRCTLYCPLFTPTAKQSPLQPSKPAQELCGYLAKPVLLLEKGELVITGGEGGSTRVLYWHPFLLSYQGLFFPDFKTLVLRGLRSQLIFILFDCPSNQLFCKLILKIVAFPKSETRW